MQFTILCKTPIMNNLLETLSFQAQVEREGKDRDIYNLTAHRTIPHLG